MKLRIALVAALIIAVAALLFTRLGAVAVWDDEAQVGIIARNLVATGTLTGWDGRNLYGYRDGSLLNDRLEYINPPLDIALAAASFRLFGVSALTVRLPFAVGAIFCVVAFTALAWRQLRDAPNHALYAAATFGLGTQFLLLGRTGRYFAVSILAQILVYTFAWLYFDRRQKRYALLAALAGAVAYYASYLLAVATLFSVLAAVIVLRRADLSRRDVPAFASSALLLAALTVPHAVTHEIWKRSDALPADKPWLLDRLTLLWWNVRDVNITGALPWMAAAALIALFVWRRAEIDAAVRKAATEWTVVATAYVLILSVLSPQKAIAIPPGHLTAFFPIADIRYLAPVLPFLAGLTGILAGEIHARNRFAGIAFLAIVVCSNLLTLTPVRPTLVPYTAKAALRLPALVAEESRPYPTGNAAVATYLAANARQNDTVLTLDRFFGYPALFYSGDRVKLCCQLDTASALPRQIVAALDAPLYREGAFPDWYIAYGITQEVADELTYFSRPYLFNGVWVRRTYAMAKMLPVYCVQTQRPELPWHEFGPEAQFDHEVDAIYIIRSSAPQPCPPPN